MINGKNQNSSGVDSDHLDRFVHHISDTRETPALMQIIAGSGEWMEITRELVNLVPESEPELWRQFSGACQKRNLDPDQLKGRLAPVARSLGISVYGSQQQDYYTLLDVDPSASRDDIRKAYHRRAKALHPDTRQVISDDQEFIQLAEGYRVLEDPVFRAHYDQSRQSMGTWCEGAACLDESGDWPDRKSRRNRYILQFGGVVLFMIMVGLVVNVVYVSRSLDDGYYSTPESMETVSGQDEEKSLANASEDAPVGKNWKAEQAVNQSKKEETSRESAVSDATESTEDISSMRLENNPEPPAHANASPDRNELRKTEQQVSINKIERSAMGDPVLGITNEGTYEKTSDIVPAVKRTGPDLIELNNITTTKNREDDLTVTNNELIPPLKTDPETNPEGKPIEREAPLLPMEYKVEDMPIFDREEPALDPDRESALAMIQSFVQKEDEVNRVNDFIKKYTETYEKKDYSAFSRLFTGDATENGESFSALAHDYRRTFATMEELEFDIKLHRTSLLVDRNAIRTEGTYRISWMQHDGSRKKNEGTISFKLVEGLGGYRVKELEYR